jgi:hopene-associated glycosyltransferase HpnB
MLSAIAAISALIWLYLIAARGAFWLASVRDQARPRPPAKWPAVAVVIPARNEADVIEASIRSLARQNYAGRFTIVLVDDDSTDDTAARARTAASGEGAEDHLKVVESRGLPPGWTGKLWAMRQGIAAAESQEALPMYLLLTDADIVHAPDTLSWLVAKATEEGLVLASLMAKLRCTSLAERVHVPAFIFFFQMLYPFAWVERPDAATAAAAGGCMLVEANALDRAGGIDSIKGALIDDCALAARLKAVGRIWLGLTDRVQSIRPYETFATVKQMVARSAYAQLRYSPLLLAGAIAAMALTFLAPPLFALFGRGAAFYFGMLGWAAMAAAFQPTLRFYALSPLWGFALPIISLLYMYYTVDSAVQHLQNRGGLWKGRVQARTASPQ